MGYIADLHLHSRFSRACSQQLNIPNLIEWAKLKGLQVLSTSDFLHPLWFSELKANLKDDGSGFLTYPKDPDVKFVLTVEVSSIYSHKGRVRRVHNVIFVPSFQVAESLQKALLSKRANLSSDGRPIVGISSKDLLRMCLELDKNIIFMPAHIWTPWFGIFGSMSGYDSLNDAFEDLDKYIYCIETGLSSDPLMNWRVHELDSRSILSNSDAHSLPNIGRESTVFGADLKSGYLGMFEDIKNNKLVGTIEFYPEEGKYHWTGHRNCNVKYSPQDVKEKGTICPVCKKGLTVGVMERVEELAGRSVEDSKNLPRPRYKMLVPLMQIIAESFGTAPTTQKVILEYKKLCSNLGGEIKVLTKADTSEISKISGAKIAEGIQKVRNGDLVIDPGYDGVFGVVKIWGNNKDKVQGTTEGVPQLGLFD